jgi:hypothetical protein
VCALTEPSAVPVSGRFDGRTRVREKVEAQPVQHRATNGASEHAAMTV